MQDKQRLNQNVYVQIAHLHGNLILGNAISQFETL